MPAYTHKGQLWPEVAALGSWRLRHCVALPAAAGGQEAQETLPLAWWGWAPPREAAPPKEGCPGLAAEGELA